MFLEQPAEEEGEQHQAALDEDGQRDDVEARSVRDSWLLVEDRFVLRFVGVMRLPRSRQDLLDHLPVHVGQAEVAAGVAVRQLLVVEAQQVQDRRVQIVDVDLVLDGGEAELVGRAVDVPALDAAAGQPHREAVVVVVAAVDLAGVRARRAAARPSACGRTRRPR